MGDKQRSAAQCRGDDREASEAELALAQGETVAQACRGIGPYVLPMAPAVWGAEDRPSEAVAGDGSGERTTQACGSRSDVGQPDTERGCRGKLLSPSRRRQCAEHVREVLGVSERRVCKVLGHPRSTQRYEPIPVEDEQGLTEDMVGWQAGTAGTATGGSPLC